jgi:hypothetical protein
VLGHTTQQATGHLAHNVVEVIHAIGHGGPAGAAR